MLVISAMFSVSASSLNSPESFLVRREIIGLFFLHAEGKPQRYQKHIDLPIETALPFPALPGTALEDAQVGFHICGTARVDGRGSLVPFGE
jgi:hypothetical protein